MTGQELIDRMMAHIRRYVVLTDGQAVTMALWALNTWVYERFNVCPYLEIWATAKRSGKSTLAEVLAGLSRGGVVLSTVRTLSMVKVIEGKEGHYVPFIEEAEKFWRGTLGDDRSILATGYRKGAVHELASSKGEVLRYRTYCPKAFVLIGNVHDILRDRCISVKLDRLTPAGDWTLERFTAEAEANAIIDAWRTVAAKELTIVDGRFRHVDPTWLVSSRDREIWSPLFSLATALQLHKRTLDLLTRASVDLSALKQLPAVRYHPGQEEQIADDGNAAEVILRDCQAVVAEWPRAGITTEELIHGLTAIDTAPWRSWRGTGIDPIALAALLSRYGIESMLVRVPTGKGRQTKPLRGYNVAAIKAAK